jgi:hypothetical protein
MDQYELDFAIQLGAYTPSIFLIKIETNDSIQYVLNSDKQFIFLHEYIHYLQDISTAYGNSNFANYYNRLKYGVNKIYNTTEESVDLPLSLSDNPKIEGVVESFPYIFGNTYKLNGIKGDALLKNNIVTIKNVNIPYYYFETPDGIYIIGSRDIKESMAYSIQRGIYGETGNPPFFPYKTVEYLISIIAPNIENTPLFISALCELSLNSSYPANMLINTLRRIADQKIEVKSIDDLCDIFVNDVTYFDHEGNKLDSIVALNNYSFNLAIEYATEIFNVPEFVKLQHWINISFNNARNYRESDPLFITRGLLKKSPITYYLNELLSKIGCPTIMNNKLIPETIDHPHNTSQVVYFTAVKELMEILFEGKKACGLYSGCLSEFNDKNILYKPDENCYESPWIKTKQDYLCPLAKLFHMWAISNKSYKICG